MLINDAASCRRKIRKRAVTSTVKKARRMAGHVEESEEEQRMSPERSKEIAWRTTHKDLSHDEREEKEG